MRYLTLADRAPAVAVPIGGTTPVALWSVDLSRVPDADAIAWLSAAEHARVARFVGERHRRRYLAAHVGLRSAVAQHCGIGIADQRFHRNARGKWHLLRAGWQISLSYAEDVALIGLSRGCAIGVDLERERPIEEADDLAIMYFTRGERRHYAAASVADRPRLFLNGWTRKEAVLKALGCGLRVPPVQIDCGLAGDRAARWGEVRIDVGSFAFDGLIGAWARLGRQ